LRGAERRRQHVVFDIHQQQLSLCVSYSLCTRICFCLSYLMNNVRPLLWTLIPKKPLSRAQILGLDRVMNRTDCYPLWPGYSWLSTTVWAPCNPIMPARISIQHHDYLSATLTVCCRTISRPLDLQECMGE